MLQHRVCVCVCAYEKTQSLTHYCSYALTYTAGSYGTWPTVRGAALRGLRGPLRGQESGGEAERRWVRAQRGGAQTSGGLTEGGGENEEAVESRAGGAAQRAASDR